MVKIKASKILLLAAVTAIALFQAKEIQASKGNCKGQKDYLLILGCRVKGDKAESTLEMRCEKAAEFLKENPDTTAIACGGIVHGDQTKSEAQVIKELLLSKGIESDRIILEDKSTTTAENFINAKALMKKGTDNAAFLSSEFHLLRAGILSKKCGLNLQSVAAPSPKNQRAKNYVRELLCFPMIYSNIKGAKNNG